MENINFTTGEVSSYTNDLGKIISNNEEYLFTPDDLENGPVKKGDQVSFRPETINEIKRAFFVFKEEKDEIEVLENDK